MLYATKEMIDGRVGTLCAAASSVDEFVAFKDAVVSQTDNRNWEETYASSLLDHMQNVTFKGFKHSVLAVYHTDEAQRDAFWTEWNLQEVQSQPMRDRHLDMLHNKKEEIRLATETEEDRTKTIEERTGLDKVDPWDRRSEEEVEEDRKMKEKMKELAKAGELSGDSFGGADQQRAARPANNDVPGAYGRSKAIDALKQFSGDDQTDFDSKTNDELKEALEGMGVPDVQGVYDDDKVPQKAAAGNGVFVEDIRGSRNEDGVFEIDTVLAHKPKGEVDEVQKAANEAAHQEAVEKAKAGRKAFSPDDFAAVLKGDGSADAVTHVEGEDRVRRGEGMSRPTLSDHAEAERKKFQDEQKEENRKRRQQAEKEADVKARGERDRGIFKGADLINDDDEPTQLEDLPEELREKLKDVPGLAEEGVLVKNYPFNSELAGRSLLPYDGDKVRGGMRVVATVNADIEGTMTMNGPGVMVVSRKDTTQDGWVIYGNRRYRQKTDELTGDTFEESKLEVNLVRIRAN